AVIWVLFGVIGEMLRRRQMKYAMLPSMTAVSYDLVVDNAVADQVSNVLGTQPMDSPTPPTGTPPDGSAPAAEPRSEQQPSPEPESEATSRGIPDLPDGRPQYG